MNKNLCPTLIFILAIFISLMTALTVEAQHFEFNRLIVKINDIEKFAQYFHSITRELGSIIYIIPEIDVAIVEVPSYLVNAVVKSPIVKYAIEDSEAYETQEIYWNIEYINATTVWDTYSEQYSDAAYGYHADVQVAVVDTGIDYKHRDLSGAVKWCVVSLRNGRTFYKGTNLNNCGDPNGHGTHVAGIIAARLNNAGVVGVAPKVQLYAIRVLDASGSGYVSDVARGIIEAVKGPDGAIGTTDDADVISMSLGGPHSPVIYDAVLYAYNNGAVLVAAAGNEGSSYPSYPAAYPEVIAVGAININYQVPSWSNRNPDIVAPGVSINSTLPRNRYGIMSGTSMSCPHVSGVVALIQAIRLASGMPKLLPQSIKEILATTATDLGEAGYDQYYGHGLVNAILAVNTSLNQ